MNARKNQSVGILIEGNSGTIREATAAVMAVIGSKATPEVQAEALRTMAVIARAPDSYSISNCTVGMPK